METMTELRDGDIYRWSYRDPENNQYWCCSRIGIVRYGILYDTYWHSDSDNKWFASGAISALTLVYLGNLSELEKAPEYQADCYDDVDFVNINHPNSTSGNFYLRKGAKRSQAKMLAVARERLEEAQADKRRAAERIDSVRGIIDRIEAGEDVPHIPSWKR